MEVYISEGQHTFTDDQARIDQSETAVSNADIVFVEKSSEAFSPLENLRLVISVPLLMGAVLTYLWLLKLAKLVLGDDTAIADHFEKEYGSEMIFVDVPHVILLEKERDFWGIINLLAFVWPLGLSLWGFLSLSVVSYGYILFFQSIIMFTTYLASTLPYRDQYMARQVVSHANQFDTGLLVIGEQHADGIRRELQRDDAVSLIEN